MSFTLSVRLQTFILSKQNINGPQLGVDLVYLHNLNKCSELRFGKELFVPYMTTDRAVAGHNKKKHKSAFKVKKT